jgi:hypothetical protein
VFRRNILPLHSGSESKPSKKSSGFVLSLHIDLKIEAVLSSETLLYLYRNTWRFIPEDGSLHGHHCENLKSKIINKNLASESLIPSPFRHFSLHGDIFSDLYVFVYVFGI